MVTTAIVGVAHIHTPGFVSMLQKRDDVRVKAVYNDQTERGEKTAKEIGATFTSDLDTILNDAEITSVIICSETVRHVELVEKCAAAGKDLFVEKPLAISGEDAARIRVAVEKAGVQFQTGFFMRSDSAVQFARQEVAAGHLGKITRMRHTNAHEAAIGGWFHPDWEWIPNKALAGGGGFADLGAHSLDIILMIMRPACGPVTKVAATLGSGFVRYKDIDEFGVGLITFESGAVAVIEASWIDPKLHSPVEINGTEGQIRIEGGKVFYYSKHVEGADGGEVQNLPEKAPHAFQLFFDKLNGKEIAVPLVTIEEAAEEARVMAEMYQSAGA